MKTTLFVAFLTSVMLSNCSSDNSKSTLVPTTTLVPPASLVALSEAEISDLKFLREEEKLARDVYLFSFDKYQISIFKNISQSEQTHTDSVLFLLNRYGISDPALTERGVFVNPVLQGLYNDLTAQASISSIEALKVGATVEDLDINDIDHFTVNTSKADLLYVYNNLNCGSKNHIRTYTNQLVIYGVNYVPQFLSVADYNSILSSANVKCGKI
jgi:hypothetical protein